MISRIAQLKENLGNLSDKDRAFAKSLVDQYERKGSLSDRQVYWVGVMADKAEDVPQFAPPTVEVGALAGMIAMFKQAGQRLKYPAITLQTIAGEQVRLTLAKATSKNPGCVYVKVDGEYSGKVTPEGMFVPINILSPTLRDRLSGLLKQLSRHPAEAASQYGKLVGKCCFCSLPLSDPKSTEVGYGRRCAEHYGLPWGNVPLKDCN